MYRSGKNKLYILVLVILVFFSIEISASTSNARPPSQTEQTSPVANISPEKIVQRAWLLAQQSGAYGFNTEIVQTIHPAPSLANVGSSSRVEQVYLQGQVNLPQETLQMALYQNGGSLLNPADGVEIRVEAERAFGRQLVAAPLHPTDPIFAVIDSVAAQPGWEEIEDFSGAFAPGGDLMAFLAGAKNVRVRDGSESQLAEIPHLAAYSFDFDGPAFGLYLRDQLEKHLRKTGELPAGLTLDVSNEYRNMIGQGEIWVDADGMPARLTVHLEYPQSANGERVEAEIKTDFVTLQPGAFKATAQTPLNTLETQIGALLIGTPRPLTPEEWGQIGLQFSFLASFLALMLVAFFQRRSKFVYATFALTMIFAMVVTPLLQSQQVFAFSEQQEEKQAAQEQQQQEQAATQQLQDDLFTSDWNPQQNPLETALNEQTTANEGNTQQQTPPTPNFFSFSSPAAVQLGDLPADASDNDGDGLTYLQESRLGTDPENADTDGDQLRDDLEVKGFYLNGQHWYSNPINPDTNNDGLVDTLECWNTLPASLPATTACDRDTDGDSTPDLFTRDNDGDGVSDWMDAAPDRVLGSASPFNAQNPFKLIIDNLETAPSGKGYPVLVDFQIRPTNPEHLTYALNVLDWPTGDDQGQVQRLEATTFANFMNPQPPVGNANWNGDMRLVPMLEIKMTGATLPLPLTTPAYQTDFRGYAPDSTNSWINGQLDFAQQGNATRIIFNFQQVNSLEQVEVYASGCPALSSQLVTQLGGVSNGGTLLLNNQNLLELADGRHALLLTQGTHQACVPLGDIPNGPYANQMIDTEKLATHGLSFRDADQDGALVAYLPLNLVQNETGAGREAFSGQMLYWADDPTLWGNAHEVRLVWLVQALDDDGNTNMIHVYPDAFTLTGLTVREDHGLDIAIAFENPENDTDPKADDALWQTARGLEAAFVTGRDQDNDGERDLTVATFKDRFDNLSNTPEATEARWGLPAGRVGVQTFHVDHQDYLPKVPTEFTPQILNTYFTANGLPRANAPTLLYAREETYRTASLDLVGGINAVTDNVLTVNMDSEKVPLDVLAATSWAPYRYAQGWEPYPIQEYYDLLEIRLEDQIVANPPEYYDPADPDAELVMTGMVKSAQAYYISINLGQSNVPESGGLALITGKIRWSHNDLSLAQTWANEGGAIAEFVAEQTVERFIDYLDEGQKFIPFPQQTTPTQEKFKLVANASKGNLQAKLNTQPTKTTFSSSKYWKMASVGMDVAALGMSVAASVAGGTAIVQIKNALAIVGAIKDVVDTVNGIREAAYSGAQGLWNSMKAASSSVSKASKIAGVVGMIISVVAVVGVFMAQMIGNERFGSLAFNAALAGTIATVIATIILFAITLIPVVGQIIAAVIALIDAVIQGICGLVDKLTEDDPDGNFSGDGFGKWFCKGISGLLTEAIAWTIFSQNALVGNMDDSNRTTTANFKPALIETDKGYIVGSQMNYSMDVKTAITLADVPIEWKALIYFWQYNFDNLDSATFRYALQQGPVDVNGVVSSPPNLGGIERDQMEDEWIRINDFFNGEDALVKNWSLSIETTLDQTGINQPANLYLTEGYAVPVQECIVVPNPLLVPPVLPVCYIRTDDNDGESVHSDLSRMVQWDVFPATLDGFYACESGNPNDACHVDGGYSLAWGQTGDLTFARQLDFDGDGLRNKADGGNDPNDSQMDSDHDGLNDPFELSQGSDPQLVDTDSDGLTDYEEFLLQTNPVRMDSDGDGLTDMQEVEGWSLVYDIDANNNPLISWVTSDPLDIDEDGDTLTDFQEKTFGFNPAVPNDPNVMDFASIAREDGTPNLLLRFEETGNATLFADVSGLTNNGFCEGYACPAVGHLGRYGNALAFDGINDALTVPQSDALNLADQPFTVAFWAKHNGPGLNFIVGQGTDAENQGLHIGFEWDNRFTCAFNGNDLETPVAYGDTDWHHWACVHTGGGHRIIYRDGVQVAAGGEGTAYQGHGDLLIGRATWGEHFNGFLDEVAIFPKGLSYGEIQDLMGARYNFNDWIVKPNQTLSFSGTVKNNMLGRYTYGLLSADLPNGLSNAVPATTYFLQPGEEKTIAGAVTVNANAASGPASLDQVAGAIVVDPNLSFSGTSGPDVYMSLSEPWGSYYYGAGYANCYTNNSCPTRTTGVGGDGQQFWGSQYATMTDSSLLDMSNGRFTFAVWLYPHDNNTWRGVFGANFGRADAYPSLAVWDNDLRFGFGTGYSWLEHTSTDVLNLYQWNHVAITFDGYTYKLYVNGQLKDQTSDPFGGRTPAYRTNFELGRASNQAKVYIDRMYINDEQDGSGNAEIYLKINNQKTQTWEDLDEGDWVNLDIPYEFTNKISIVICEDDANDDCEVSGYSDDLIGRVQFTTADASKNTYDWYFGDGVSEDSYVTIYLGDETHKALDNPTTPYIGKMDEFSIYRRTLRGEEIQALSNSGLAGVQMHFDEVPGAGISGRGFVNASDLTGRTRGTCQGEACPISGLPGRDHQALYFDGNDSVEVPYNVEGTNEFSLAAWVKYTGDAPQSKNAIMEFGGSQPGFYMLQNGSLAGYSNGVEVISGGQIPYNTWTHVAYTVHGSTNKLFINGKLVGFNYNSPNQHGQSLRIGANWVGFMDDVYVSRRELSETEIKDLIRAAVPELSMRFNEPAGANTFSDDGGPYPSPETWCARVAVTRFTSNSTQAYYGNLTITSDSVPSVYESFPFTNDYTFSSNATMNFCGYAQIWLNYQSPPFGYYFINQSINASTPGEFEINNGNARLFYTVDSYQYSPPVCTTCPKAGLKGQVGLSAEFDGVDDAITVGLPAPQDNFTLMAWIQYEGEPTDRYRTILEFGNDEPSFSVDQGQLNLYDAVAGGSIAKGIWTHVAYTWDGQTSRLFQNGYQVASSSSPPSVNGLELGIGYHNGDSHFLGRMDEVAIYERALSQYEIRDTFVYQAQWIEERQSFPITIDAEAPVSSLRSYQAGKANYRANQDVILDLQASDITSYVTLAELGIQKDGQSGFTWISAAACQDAAQGIAWCPTFDPTVLGGEGTYTLQTRAIDAVGNREPPNASYIFYIDDTPPNLTSDLTDGEIVGVQQAPEVNAWVVPLSGSVHDPALSSGDAGSGIQEVWATLLQADGLPAGEGKQPALWEDGQWTLDYLVYDANPTAPYTLTVETLDAVGNARQLIVAPLQLSYTPPLVSADVLTPTITLITPTYTLHGWVTSTLNAGVAGVEVAFSPLAANYPLNNPLPPEGSVLALPLDDTPNPDGNLIFQNLSGVASNGSCSGDNCPTVGINGLFGSAAWFDGNDDQVLIPASDALNLANQAFTVAFWAKRNTLGGNDFITGQGSRNTNQSLHIGFRANNHFTCAFYGNDLDTTVAYNDTEWHHWACVHTGGGNRIIYRDGVQVASGGGGTAYQGSGDFFVGKASWDSYFNGSVDEVFVFKTALSADDIQILTTPPNQPLLVLPLDLAWMKAGDPLPDTSGSEHPVVLHTGSLDADNKSALGQVGAAALRFDGIDDYAETPHALNLQPNAEMTLAAWVNLTDPVPVQKIAGKAENISGGTRGFVLGVANGQLQPTVWDQNGTQYTFSAGNIPANTWVHLAMTWQTNRALIAYINGEEVGRLDVGARLIGETTTPFILGTSPLVLGQNNFGGRLDDFRFYGQTLSAGQLQALVQIAWHPAPLDQSGPGVLASPWTFTPPTGLEGNFQLDLRATDVGNLHTFVSDQWHGLVDTRAPEIDLQLQNIQGSATYTTLAQDTHLSETGFASPCGAGIISERGYVLAPGGDVQTLAHLKAACLISITGHNTREVGVYNSNGTHRTLAIAGNYAYLSGWNHDLRVVDVSNPTLPQEIFSGNVVGLIVSSVIKIYGNHAYIGGAYGFSIYNIANPSNPYYEGGIITGNGGFGSSGINDLVVYGNYLYAFPGDNTLRIYNIADPAHPMEVNQWIGRERAQFEKVQISGHYAYVLDKFWSEITIFDLSNPIFLPIVRTFYINPPASDLALSGQYLYLVAGKQLRVYDIASPSNPVPINSLDLSTTQYFDNLTLSDNYAYIKDATNWKDIRIVDITDPYNLFQIGQYTAPSTVWAINTDGNALYALTWEHGLRIVESNLSSLSASACDLFGNCATTNLPTTAVPDETTPTNDPPPADEGLPPILPDASTPLLPPTDTVPPTFSHSGDLGLGLLNAPVTLTNTTPLTLTGWITAPNFLRALTVTVSTETAPLYTQAWAGEAITETLFNIPWTPAGTGEHLLTIQATDWLTGTAVYTQSIEVHPATPHTSDAMVALNLYPILMSTAPLTVTGWAYASESLRTLTVTVSSQDTPLYTQIWANGTVTSTVFAFAWTPQEGEYHFNAQATDWLTATATYSTSVLVDTTPPTLTLATNVLTSTEHTLSGKLNVTGWVSDNVGLRGVSVVIGNSAPIKGEITGNTWTGAWFTDLENPPDGVTLPLTVTATDRVGHATSLTAALQLDVAAPAPFDLILTHNGSLLQPGDILREISPTLTLTWTASSDGSGLAGYRVEWQAQTALSTTQLLATLAPTATLATQFSPPEGSRTLLQVAAIDSFGNPAWQTFSPLYTDSPLTPDYILLNPSRGDGLYTGWMNSSCSLLGVDRRIDRLGQDGAALDGEQRLYTSWDSQALRLTWTGANWDTDGNLFIYLDTQAGGSVEAYNPFEDGNRVMLPGAAFTQTRTLVRPGEVNTTSLAPLLSGSRLAQQTALNAETGFEADWAIWVSDAKTAVLMAWDGETWIQTAVLSDTMFAFETSVAQVPLTHLYLPFNLLGLTPEASLDLVAFASEEDTFQLWAAMPASNPVSSARVLEKTNPAEADLFGLTRGYHWDSLGDGVCVNGTLSGTQTGLLNPLPSSRYADTDLHFTLTPDPSGTVYSFMGDGLFTLWGVLFGGKTADISSLFDFTDTDHYPLGDNQTVTFSLQYENLGRDTAQDVWVDVSSYYALFLPEGEHLPDEYRDHQVVNLGDIGPGESGTTTFFALVDLTTARNEYYIAGCLDYGFPDYVCQTFLTWASIDAYVYDADHPDTAPPLEWLWVDHKVDSAAPEFFGIQTPTFFIADTATPLLGYGYDPSGIDHYAVDIHTPFGWGDYRLECPDPTPMDGQWTCNWPRTGFYLEDGDLFFLRTQATDGQGQLSPWSAWQPFVVDKVAPTATLDENTSSAPPNSLINGDTLTLVGDLVDNHAVGRVEICQGEECTNASFYPAETPTYVYEDVPETPLPIGAGTFCDGGEIQRTFTVPDSFPLGQVSFGLNAEHSIRDDILAELISPAGTIVRLTFDDTLLGTHFNNLDVFLSDSTAAGLFDFKGDDATSSPFYDRSARPYHPLSAFKGESSAGTWTLTICDVYGPADDGLYNRGQLVLKPQNTAPESGTWRANLVPPAGLDGVPLNLTVYGYDLAGNRSNALDLIYIIDNVTPVLTITEILPQTIYTGTIAVASGLFSDGDVVTGITATILTPGGAIYQDAITWTSEGTWTYALHPVLEGEYLIWIVATDAAGNQYSILTQTEVNLPPTIYLPLIFKN